MEFCKDCDKKEECVKLCKKAERYVNQDNVMLGEILLRSTDIFSESMDYGLNRYTKKSIINLHNDGKSVKDIAYQLPFSKRWIQMVIQNYKERIYD